MINIQNAVQVPYNDDTAFVTVYFDYDNENLWYAVPVPRVARDANGHPALTVTKYLNASGESSGHLNMDVEVEIPQPALDAIKAAYPDKERGEFQWIATDCYLTFDLPSQPDGAIIQGQASLYGKNRANFNLNLGSEEDLNAVIGAFKGVPTSSFQLEYDMTTLTKLLGVKAKVSFDAQVAIDFETIWKEETDTWGNSKQVAAGVKKNLKVSKAGDVDINWNTPPSDEFRARVTEWAWTTLEKAVTNAVATAQAAAEGGDPVSSVDSFSQEYTETSVIEWDIISTSPLEGFTDSDWNEFIFHEVDNRELSVNFSLKGKLVNEKDEPICKEVKITVDYPTKTTGNTFILNPVEEGKTTLTYSAPGNTSGGSYDPNFRYRYETIYSDQDVYDSGWIDSSDTEITIIPNELGAKQVRFVGSNIPFGDEPSEVKKVRIDFFFERPEGYENVTQIAELTSNDDIGHTFSSFFKVPLTNNYSYRFVYELNDGTVRVLNTTEGFGSPNSDILPIQTILKEHTFNLRVARQKNPDLSVDGAYLDVQYVDKQNAEESKAHAFDWEVEWPQSEEGSIKHNLGTLLRSTTHPAPATS